MLAALECGAPNFRSHPSSGTTVARVLSTHAALALLLLEPPVERTIELGVDALLLPAALRSACAAC
eukprot:3803670-Prymnesium_polylepis.1